VKRTLKSAAVTVGRRITDLVNIGSSVWVSRKAGEWFASKLVRMLKYLASGLILKSVRGCNAKELDGVRECGVGSNIASAWC
jgi:hypothetical protein